MTNSDRLQEIRERVQLTRETYPNNGTILLLGSDLDGLLQLVTEQQREIDRCRKALEAVNEFAKEDDICTHKTIGEQHGWGACFVCLIQATAQGALRGENGPFESDDEPEAKGYRKQERPI